MSCGCYSHVGAANPLDTDEPPKKPCASCMAAARAIAPAPIRLGAAADDVTTLQQFLQQISTTQTFPTAAELAAAQQAATNLSTEVPGMTGAPTTPATAPASSSMTVSPTAVILMAAGAALLGGGVVYLATTRKKRR